jgi:hypothetical protein
VKRSTQGTADGAQAPSAVPAPSRFFRVRLREPRDHPQRETATISRVDPGSRSRWRPGLRADSTDTVGKALRHRRFDLFYGPYYLRFTRSLDDAGRLRLRLEELARLVEADPGGPELRPAGRASSRFVLEEVLPGTFASDARPLPLDSGRLFFERAAHLLDDGAAVPRRPPTRNASSG